MKRIHHNTDTYSTPVRIPFMFHVAGCPGIWVPLVLAFVCGCSPEPQFRRNAVHKLTIEREFLDGEKLPADQMRQLDNILTSLFGTPSEPWMPPQANRDDTDSGKQYISLDHLKLASGPVSSTRDGQQRGLYREHCAHCHGISGDGAGPTAAFLNPYPRDFRLGKFKFKQTKLRGAPTDEDLQRIIRNGIPGTAMPSFSLLDDQELEALVDYVKYLSIRGETERKLMEECIDLEPDELLISQQADESQDRLDQLGYVMEIVEQVIKRWKRSPQAVSPVPPQPNGFVQRLTGYAITGRELFYGKANCTQCHGQTGLGDGQTEGYDDWTNEWLKRANVDLNDWQDIAQFIEVGAFPPRKIRPRNLRLRIFRGGPKLSDVYRRIANGIEGTPMPATSLTADEIWALVAFVLELPPHGHADEGE